MIRLSILMSVLSAELILWTLGLLQVMRANFVRISCSYNDGKSLKSEIPSPFPQLSAIGLLRHLGIFLTCSAFCFNVIKPVIHCQRV